MSRKLTEPWDCWWPNLIVGWDVLKKVCEGCRTVVSEHEYVVDEA